MLMPLASRPWIALRRSSCAFLVDRVQMVTPPAGSPEGWDLADATWSEAQALDHLKGNLSQPLELDELIPELTASEPEPDTEPDLPDLDPNGHFTCLGFDGDAYYYQPHSTGQIIRLSRSGHTATNLVALAPLDYWAQLCPGQRSAVDWTQAAATLFAINADRGVYNPNRIRGRGAWWDDKRTILHLGDQLIIDGSRRPVLQATALQLPVPAHVRAGSDPVTLSRSPTPKQWHCASSPNGSTGKCQHPDSCSLAGSPSRRSVVPCHGGLMSWLTAAAGSGKSAILDRYVAPLLADMGLIVAGNTTEAGLRQTLRSDAMPVVFDEAGVQREGRPGEDAEHPLRWHGLRPVSRTQPCSKVRLVVMSHASPSARCSSCRPSPPR
jgi:putative DNA primase/helicase